ncbi:MAG TPA: type 4a pilus biogenesis protein PilO [Desulfuromonadales bacterium]|jgi:type IV pilus assembly protein PilO|nr:type 4a pilus biogenesis protein PilO [Desulfuromonadales bacterium]
MNPKLEKLLKLPLYQRVAILAVLVVLLVGAFTWVALLPEYEKIGEMDQELSRLEADLVQKQRIANNLPKFKAEFLKLEEQLKAALTQLPNKKEIPSLLTNLATIARDNGLDVVSFSPRGEVSKGFYAEVPGSVDLVGTYHQIAEFAQAVSKLSRIVNLSDLELSSPKVEGDVAVLKIKCKVTTFRFVDNVDKKG